MAWIPDAQPFLGVGVLDMSAACSIAMTGFAIVHCQTGWQFSFAIPTDAIHDPITLNKTLVCLWFGFAHGE